MQIFRVPPMIRAYLFLVILWISFHIIFYLLKVLLWNFFTQPLWLRLYSWKSIHFTTSNDIIMFVIWDTRWLLCFLSSGPTLHELNITDLSYMTYLSLGLIVMIDDFWILWVLLLLNDANKILIKYFMCCCGRFEIFDSISKYGLHLLLIYLWLWWRVVLNKLC